MIFFVISGFVLRLSLEHGPQKKSAAAGKFFVGRIFRMYPIVIFGVLLTAVLARWHTSAPGQADRPLTLPLFLANLLLLDVSINGTLWALQVELLMAPVIVGLYFLERSRGPRVLLGIAVVATALAFTNRWALWPPLSTNVFPFVLGMIVPTLGRRFALSLSKRAACLWTVGAVTTILLTRPCFGLYSRPSAIIEAYGAVILVSLVAYRFDIAGLRCLDARAFRLLGRSSGSYYVLHMATVPVVLAMATQLIPRAWSVLVPALVGCLVVAGWLVAMFPLAVSGFYLIEAPGIALGQRVLRLCRLNSRPVAQPGGKEIARKTAA
jgi:peptidoglycan/LPS O-acetylase OafA/YrhL